MTPEAALEYLALSLSDLVQHRHQTSGGDDPTGVELRHAAQGLGVVHCQVHWVRVPSSVAKEFLWDCVTVETGSPEGSHQFLEDVRNKLALAISSTPATALRWRAGSDVALFSIQPLRYRALHPLAKKMSQAASDPGAHAFSQSVMQLAANAYMEAQRSDLPASCLRFSVAHSSRRAFSDTLSLATFHADFVGAGRNIFSFPPEMVAMFSRTDVTDIPLDAINLPFRSLYLAFGPQDELEIEPGWVADGAYVSMVGDRQALQFALTAAPRDPSWYARWLEHPEPAYVQSIDASRMAIGVGEAVELVFSDQMAELRKQVASGGMKDLPEGVTDVTARNAAEHMLHIERRYQAWLQAMRLVVNALAYLSAYPEDVEKKWPQGTPQNLYLQTQDGSFKQKRNATSKLAELGYSEIHYCGKTIQQQLSRLAQHGDLDSKLATWVRGHWRRQPYGPQSSLRKLILIMPVLRNAANAGESDEIGHIYKI